MGWNLPDGVTDADIDRACGEDEWGYDELAAEMKDEEEFFERLEREAAMLPAAEFPECAAAPDFSRQILLPFPECGPGALVLNRKRALAETEIEYARRWA